MLLIKNLILHIWGGGTQFPFLRNGPAGLNYKNDRTLLKKTYVSGPTIFSKLLDGTIPCKFIHEDDKAVAFMDVNPQVTFRGFSNVRILRISSGKSTDTYLKMCGFRIFKKNHNFLYLSLKYFLLNDLIFKKS